LFSFQYYIYRVYHARVYLKVSFKDDKGIYQRSNINGFVLSLFYSDRIALERREIE